MGLVVKIILILNLNTLLFAQSLIPFTAKVPTAALVYFTKDAEISYYKKRSHTFDMVAKNKTTQLLKLDEEFHLWPHASYLEKRIVFEVDPTYYSHLNIKKDNDLYLSQIGSNEIELIGRGIQPKLHLADTWISFYSPSRKRIFFYHAPSKELKFNIEVNNPINPYFIPQVEMINPQTIVYTDVNQKSQTAALVFNPISESFEPLYQTTQADSFLSLCNAQSQLVIADFSQKQGNLSALHIALNLKDSPPYQTKQIYQNDSAHIGSITCKETDNLIYFIKSFSSNPSSLLPSDLVRFNLSEMKYEKISHNSNINQVYLMGGEVFASQKSKILILNEEGSQ